MHGVTAKEVELYAASFIADDVWRNAGMARRTLDRAMLSTDLVGDHDYQNSRIYTDLCRPNTDIFHGVMVTGSLPDKGVFSLGIHRPRRAKSLASFSLQLPAGSSAPTRPRCAFWK